MKVGIIQQSCSRDIELNMSRLKDNITRCAKEGAEVIVLQEIHNTLYFCQTENTDNFDLAETIPGPSTEYFGKIARRHKVVLVLSLFEKRTRGLYYNTAVVIEKDGTIAGTYRKMHIPDDPGFYEKFYFTPGDKGFEPIKTSAGTLGVLVCWDQWYPEAARIMTLKGAEILIYPTAIGWSEEDDESEQHRQLEAWVTVQRGHAIANGVPVVAVNRTGFEPDPSGQTSGIRFWGNSFISGPQGEMIYETPYDSESVVVVDVNLERTEQVRRWWPFLRDRRIDNYDSLDKRYIGE